MNKKIKKGVSIRRALCTLVALISIITMLNPVTAKAKEKSVRINTHDWTYFTSVAKKTGKKITVNTKKGSKYNVYMWRSSIGKYKGYVKFVAPKTKKYTIRVSSLFTSTVEKTHGHMMLQTKRKGNKNKLSIQDMTVNGYKRDTLKFGNDGYSLYPYTNTAKYKLKKGQYCFLYFEIVGTYKQAPLILFDLYIK